MKTLKFIALISILLFLATLCVWSVAAIGVERTVLSESYYREIIVERKVVENIRMDVLERLPGKTLEILEEKRGRLDTNERQALEKVAEAVQSAAASSFGISWLEEGMMNNVPGIVQFLRGGNKGLYAVIHLGGRMDEFEKTTVEELKKIDEKYLKQAGMEDGDIEKFAHGIIDEMEITDSINIGKALEETLLRITDRDITTLTVWRRISYFAPYAIAVVLCLALCLMYGKGGGILRTGIAVTIPSLAMIFALTGTRGRLPEIIVENTNIAPESYVVGHVIKPIVDTVIQRFIVTPIIMSIAGVLLIATGSLIIIHNRHVAENAHPAREFDIKLSR